MKHQRHVEGLASVSASTWKRRVFVVALLTVIAVTMIGWLIGLGWAAIWFANWIFSYIRLLTGAIF